MRHISLIALLLLVLTSCHSNEKNYKMAYDKAVERRSTSIDAETEARIAAERKRNAQVIYGDTVVVVRMHTTVVADTIERPPHRYNVVVGVFKQEFNAKSYRDRFRKEAGYPSYVLKGVDAAGTKFHVVIKGFDEKDVASAFISTIHDHVKIRLLEREPWILEAP
ncbi:MAG: SPOR domain-containing protein [Muribaculaceae bacterium]|jgi:uncharacterized protein YcfL|nr:SPOR domain-containing protein [Muribaculaceae bacterium]MBQ2485184.1 SPOR domain-containing protein [Muribaculaceae bacterium]MBQ4006889.1 SPOR domain-containing protein [Muribaculaceae bacterium]